LVVFCLSKARSRVCRALGAMEQLDGPLTEASSTPRPPRKRVLEDMTNTPAAVMGPSHGGQAPAIARAARLAATSVQRFSLKSRRVGTGSGTNYTKLSCPSLTLPPRIAGEIPGPVMLCHCSWAPGLASGRRRLCQQNTEDHAEFRLLEVMNSRFIEESGMTAVLITHKACFQELEVFFVIQPDSDTVVGYVAFRNFGTSPSGMDRALRPITALSQIYIEPDYRKRGMAAAALRVLLAGRGVLAVEAMPAAPDAPLTVASPMHRMLERLGFKVGASLAASEDEDQVLVYRRLVATLAESSENF